MSVKEPMKTKIEVKVIVDPKEPTRTRAIVRLVRLTTKGQVSEKYGLSSDGLWWNVSEGGLYPDECLLPVEIAPVEEEQP